jgi:two-component system LytT family response regulator
VSAPLRVIIADDERPARSFLAALVRSFDDVILVGEAESGHEALSLIDREKPDLALLDIHMPELDGLAVVRALRKHHRTLVAFVTAFDEYAVDYLLKPVDQARLREAINRAQERIEHEEIVLEQTTKVGAAFEAYQSVARPAFLDRIPVRKRDEVILLPVAQVASVVAEGELLHLTTVRNERHTITHALKDLEVRLDPTRFIRLGRGTLVNVDAIVKVNVMPGGSHVAVLANGQKLKVSRIQSRLLRDRLLRL